MLGVEMRAQQDCVLISQSGSAGLLMRKLLFLLIGQEVKNAATLKCLANYKGIL
jgi:hypothetical protein